MAEILLSICQVLLFGASMYGWGRLTGGWCYRGRRLGWAFTAALGIAAAIAMGGMLNAVHLARSPILAAMLIAGLGLTVFFIYTAGRLESPRASAVFPSPSLPASATAVGLQRAGTFLFYGLLLAVLVFLVSALMPARNFNFHDDFHIYLMWPVRMLQTGSLGGNPFDHIGLSNLGGQSFMQGIFLTFGSIADINVFDAVLCLILFLGLLKELGERLELHIVFILAACIVALFINPQYVNISSLYSASLMLLGLTYATLLLSEALDSSDASGIIRAAAPCSFFAAALLSLKTTFIFTAPLFWAASLVGLLLLRGEKRQVLLAHAAGAIGAVVLLLPWLIIHLDRYIRKIHYILDGIGYPKGKEFSGSLLTKGDVLKDIFSQKELFWGNTYRDYLTIVVMLCLVLAAASLVAWRGKDRRDTGRLIPMLAALLSVLLTYPLYYTKTWFMADRIVRYSCPLLIAAAPVAILLAGWLWTEGNRGRQRKSENYKLLLVPGVLLLILQTAIVGIYRETFMERLKRANDYGTLLSFAAAQAPRNIEYNQYALSDAARGKMSSLQDLTPKGESILALVSMPMYLDYGRNTIYPTHEYGLSNQLLIMPFTEGPAGMRRFFRRLGIRYFIWEYAGYGMKPQALYGGIQRKFIQTLTELLPASRTLYNDGGTVVFDIGQDT
jgi:hypothetical protein